jgi:Zn-finger nucleic acid-binding protein
MLEVDIDYCSTCKGVWLDKGEIDKIANMQSTDEEEYYQKYHRDQRDYGDDDDDDDDDSYFNRRRCGFFGDLFNFD